MRDTWCTDQSIRRLPASGGKAFWDVAVPPQARRAGWVIALLLLFVFAAGTAHAQTPNVTGVSPSFGPAGTTVTVSGTGFGSTQGPDSSLTFCGLAASSIISWSDTSISGTVPPGPTWPTISCDVVVRANGVSSSCCTTSTVFDYSPPVITDAPAYGKIGNPVIISGVNFGFTPGTVTFNGTPATLQTTWTTSFSVLVPAGATSGNIVVTSSHGVPSNGIPFIVIHPAGFYLIPDASTTPGLRQLRSWRAPFVTASYTSSDLVNQPAGDYLVQAFDTAPGVPNSSDTWQSILPASASVYMRQTAGTTGTLFPKVKLFLNGPSGTPICTATGSTALTTSQTLYNLGCTPSADLTVSPSDRYYLWVGVSSTATPSSSTIFQITIGPAGGRGRGDTVLSVPLAAHIPTITNSDSQYYNAGTSFTITGTDFGATAGTLTFNGETAVVSSWSDTSITALVPNDAYGRNSIITVFSANNVQSNPWTVSVVAAINNLTPASGAIGSSVIISGSGFGPSAGSVFFNNTTGVITSWSNASITATVPAGTTTGNTYVQPADPAAFLSNPFTFTVVPPPSISSLSSTSGTIGSNVVITGTHFGSDQGVVTFNGVGAAVSSWSDTSITATVPLGANTGNVIVTAVGGVSSAGALFTVTGPVVTSIQPSAGVAGDHVVISGTDFGAQQGSSTVTLNGLAPLITSWSPTQIQAVVPRGISTGPVIVTVYGIASNTDVIFSLAPRITTLTPSLGSAGASVVISGLNFGATQGTSSVKFNGVSAPITSWSNTEIHVNVPSATSGPVQVVVNGAGSNPAQFTVIGSGTPAAVLQLRSEDSPATVNLSDPVNLDWITWGADGNTPAANRKAGTSLISNFTALSGTPDIFGGTFGNQHFTWTGGTPIANSSDISTTGVTSEVSTFDENGGFQLTVPADTTVRTLRLYVEFENSVQINASLSDGSMPAISQTFSVPDSLFAQKTYLVDFRAASAGQTLQVQIISTDPNGFIGLEAATLQNHAPEVNILSPADGQEFIFPVTVLVGLEATQFDSTIANTQILGAGSVLASLQSAPYTWNWQPAPGHYSLQGQAVDTAGLTGTSRPVEVDVIGSGGSLSLSTALATAGAVDLTSEGTADWILFTPREKWTDLPNPENYSGTVRKGGAGQQIFPVTALGGNISHSCQSGDVGHGVRFQFEDGTPDPQESGLGCTSSNYMLGGGLEFTVKADTTPRTLRVHAGISNGRGKLVAFLSDGSAPVIIDDSVSSIDRQGVVYSITFSAASAGQTLTVHWLLEDVFNPNTGDFFLFGHVGISSATLDGQPVPLTPSVTSIQPNPANPGQVIAISGNSFGGATGAVNVGGVPAQVISWSDSEIQAVVPTAACGGPLVVFANGLSSSDAALTINQPLAIIPQTAGLSVGQTLQLKAQAGACTGASTGTSWSITSSSTPGIATLSSGDQPTLTAVGAGTATVSVTVGSSSASATFTLTPQGPPPTPPVPPSTTPPASTRNVTVVTDSLGNQTTYTTFLVGGKQMLTDSAGSGCSSCAVQGETHSAFDSRGNTLTNTNALGARRFSTYDENNNATSVSVPVDATTYSTSASSYNGLGQEVTVTDALGNATTNTYDSNGNLLSIMLPAPDGGTAPSITHFDYDIKGEVIQVTDALGRITKMTYTPVGLVDSITDAQQNITRFEYDLRGNRTAVVDPLQNRTTFAYDQRDRLITVTYPDSTTATFTYDHRGRKTSATDQNGRTTSYVYDDADRLVSITDPAGNSTQYGYDTESHRLRVTDAMGRVTSFAYDANGRIAQTTFPSGLTESYTYDPTGNLTSKTDRKGQTISYAYDLLNRGTHKGYPDSTGVDYVYDLAGRVRQVSDSSGIYGITYDNMGRIVGTTTQYTLLPGKTFSDLYAYDAASNRISFTGSDGSTKTYEYDAMDRLSHLTDSATGQFTFGYDALGRRTGLTRPNAVATTYDYDSLSHLLSVLHKAGNTTLDGASYTYDNAGNRNSKTNSLNNATDQYAFDSLDELTQATEGAATMESYSFDAVGNRLSSLGVPSYSYNSSNELTATSAASFTYDNNGNPLSKTDSAGTTVYTWDFENRLTSVQPPNQAAIFFQYDPYGRRIKKGVNLYAYDGTNLIQEADSSGNLVARYVFGTGIDELLAAHRDGVWKFYEADGLGSITSLSTSAGSISDTFVYDSFGNVPSATGSFTQPFRYAGREWDSETDLYYNRARYYDPHIGRFISEDPIGFEGGLNFYAYAGNNPLIHSDPSGTRVYIVAYGTGYNGTSLGGDFEFMLSAFTRANAINAQPGFNPQSDIILYQGVSTKSQFLALLDLAGKLSDKYGQIDELDLFAHTGDIDGPVFPREPGGRAHNQFKPGEFGAFDANWAPNANAYFYGCRSANFAKNFANATGVTSHGYVQPVGFSSDPNHYSSVWSTSWDGYGGPLYMIPKVGPGMQTYPH